MKIVTLSSIWRIRIHAMIASSFD